MSDRTSSSARSGAGLAAVSLLAVTLACGQWDSPAEEIDSRLLTGADTATIALDVTSIQVRVEDAMPTARFMGRLPDGCTQVTGADARREGSTFFVTLDTAREGTDCATIGLSFDQYLALSDSAITDGYYAIRVAGTTASAGFDVVRGALRDTTLGPGWNAMPPDTLGVAPDRDIVRPPR